MLIHSRSTYRYRYVLDSYRMIDRAGLVAVIILVHFQHGPHNYELGQSSWRLSTNS